MISFAKRSFGWFNKNMKNSNSTLRDKLVAKYLEPDTKKTEVKNTDINVLLNRVKLNQKNESRKKLYFSAAASTGLILFGLIIF
tara:strand:+ start:1075 stop:1326 length:252 start_codon:yes stop_codon:yes gene_type:complete